MDEKILELQHQAAAAHYRAARLNELAVREIWTFDDLAFFANIAPGTMEKMIRIYPPIGMFSAGKNRHIMADAGRDWVKMLAEKFRTDGAPKIIARVEKA